MWIKKMYVVSRFFIGKTPVGILRNDREGDDKGNVKTNKQTNKQATTNKAGFGWAKKQGKNSARGSHFFVNFFVHTAQEIRLLPRVSDRNLKPKQKKFIKELGFCATLAHMHEQLFILYRVASPFDLKGNPVKCKSSYNQKHITPKRLNSPYLFRTMLGFFSPLSRPIRSTEK